MRKNSAILLIVILLTTQLLGMANTPCVCDSTYKSTYRGKFLREIITIDGIDSLIDGKDFFVRYQDSHRALWTIVVRDSGGFNFIHPSLDRQSIIFAPSCSLDTIVTHTFSDIFNWILDSLSINGIVYERGPKEPFIDEHPGWRKVGFEVYQKDGSNIFAYDARDHSRIEAKNIDLEAFFMTFFFSKFG